MKDLQMQHGKQLKNLNEPVFLLQEQAWLDLFRIRFNIGFKYLQVKNSLTIQASVSKRGIWRPLWSNQIVSVEGELFQAAIVLISEMWQIK